MINQIFLESAGSHIMCVIKRAYPISEIKGAVLLVPGYSQGMCDTDYFMTRLSNELINQRYATLQLDIYGHGDSYGDLSKLNWATIESNIVSAYEYMKEWCRNKTLIGISRGLFANVLCIDNISRNFDNIICVNPIAIEFDITKYSKYYKNEIIDVEDIMTNDDLLEGLFVLMGAETTNIRGQKINLSFLFETLTRINNYLCPPNAIILSTYNDNAQIKKEYFSFISSSKFDVEYLSKRCFLREYEWQENLIDKIVKNVIKGEETSENTVSD